MGLYEVKTSGGDLIEALSGKDVISLAKSGRITQDCLIRQMGQPAWRLVKSVPQIAEQMGPAVAPAPPAPAPPAPAPPAPAAAQAASPPEPQEQGTTPKGLGALAASWVQRAGQRVSQFAESARDVPQQSDSPNAPLPSTAAVKREASEPEDPDAQFTLGYNYSTGNGVEKDLVEGAKWYLRAAEQGHAYAQFNLATVYSTGQGVVEDKAEAAKWFRRAAQMGIADAQYQLAFCFIKGEGVAQNRLEALKWLHRASEQGHDHAKAALTVLEPKDPEEQCKIGKCFADGIWIPQDWEEAARWFKKAAEQGHDEAKQRLQHIPRMR